MGSWGFHEATPVHSERPAMVRHHALRLLIPMKVRDVLQGRWCCLSFPTAALQLHSIKRRSRCTAVFPGVSVLSKPTPRLFSLADREINLNIIAALLTLIGYSMNDKIVVFDRVRENLKAKGVRTSYLELVNCSINQTLSRTLLTAGPTLLACLALYWAVKY